MTFREYFFEIMFRLTCTNIKSCDASLIIIKVFLSSLSISTCRQQKRSSSWLSLDFACHNRNLTEVIFQWCPFHLPKMSVQCNIQWISFCRWVQVPGEAVGYNTPARWQLQGWEWRCVWGVVLCGLLLQLHRQKVAAWVAVRQEHKAVWEDSHDTVMPGLQR